MMQLCSGIFEVFYLFVADAELLEELIGRDLEPLEGLLVALEVVDQVERRDMLIQVLIVVHYTRDQLVCLT